MQHSDNRFIRAISITLVSGGFGLHNEAISVFDKPNDSPILIPLLLNYSKDNWKGEKGQQLFGLGLTPVLWIRAIYLNS